MNTSHRISNAYEDFRFIRFQRVRVRFQDYTCSFNQSARVLIALPTPHSAPCDTILSLNNIFLVTDYEYYYHKSQQYDLIGQRLCNRGDCCWTHVSFPPIPSACAGTWVTAGWTTIVPYLSIGKMTTCN